MIPKHTADSEVHSHPSPARRFFAFLQPERREIGTLILFSIVAGILYLATPLTVDAVVNNIAFGGEQQVYVQALAILAVALLALLLLLGAVRVAQDYVMEMLQQRIFVRMTADLTFRLPRVRIGELDSRHGPELVNRFFDVVILQKSAAGLLLDGINVVFSTLIGLLVLGIYHPTLLSFALGLLFLIAAVVWFPQKRGVRSSIRESYAKHAIVGWLEQMVMFPLLFRSRGGAEMARARSDALAHEYLAARTAHFHVLIGQVIGLLTIQSFASVSLLALGGWLVLRGELTLGQLVASELILAAILSSLSKLGKHMENWYDALAAVDKLGYLTDLPIEREDGEEPEPHGDEGLAVQLHDLGFRYTEDRPLIEKLSANIPAGSRVAVVGAAGHGASTLLDLLAGLREPGGGTLLFDGLDLRQWKLGSIRRQVALVRGHEIVKGSILDNIRLGREDISARDVQDALHAVGILDAFLGLPNGLATELSPGGAPLSGSQRTLLALARAIVGRPRLLLLDETLEAMDEEFLPTIRNLLFDPRRPWTLVIVTHEPGVLQRCDRTINLGGTAIRTAGATVREGER